MSVAWIECDEIGCSAGMQIDVRHWDNITARDWYCAEHDGSR